MGKKKQYLESAFVKTVSALMNHRHCTFVYSSDLLCTHTGGVIAYVGLVQNTMVCNFDRQNIFKTYCGILTGYSDRRNVIQNIP